VSKDNTAPSGLAWCGLPLQMVAELERPGDSRTGWETNADLMVAAARELCAADERIRELEARSTPPADTGEVVAEVMAEGFFKTGMGFDGPHDQDSPLQAAAREAGWALMQVVDLLPFEKRQHVQNIYGKLAVVIDAAPPPGARPDREAVARTIDPKAFDHPVVHAQHLTRRRKAALAKAEAILSLYPAEGKGGVSEAQPSPLPANEAWIPWTGGKNPVPGQMVQFRRRDGFEAALCPSDKLRWTLRDAPDQFDIIAYRIAQPEGGEG